jgi:hypothetical protein
MTGNTSTFLIEKNTISAREVTVSEATLFMETNGLSACCEMSALTQNENRDSELDIGKQERVATVKPRDNITYNQCPTVPISWHWLFPTLDRKQADMKILEHFVRS